MASSAEDLRAAGYIEQPDGNWYFPGTDKYVDPTGTKFVSGPDGESTSTGTGTGDTGSTSTSSGSSVDQIRSIFDEYGIDIATPGETEEQRLDRLLNQINSGFRSFESVRNDIINLGGKYDPLAAPEYGGTGGFTPSGEEPSSNLIEQLRQMFNRYNVGIANVGETETQRLTRIATEISSGFRTLAEVEQAISLISQGKSSNQNSLPGSTSQALPVGSMLVRVGNEYRVIWALGQNQGWAWYSIDGARVNSLFGEDPRVFDTLPNSGSFDAKYGANYWGNVAEISQTADSPWHDMTNRIYDSFGFVPGMDEPEVRNMLLQGWFEGWSADEFIANYRGTDYFNSLNDRQREWYGKSEAERETTIETIMQDMTTAWMDLWGSEPTFDLRAEAELIASGQKIWEEWLHIAKQGAQGAGGTPAALDKENEERAVREPEITKENLGAFVEEQWRMWVGPFGMPADLAARWGSDLYLNHKSTADLEKYLKDIASSQWPEKPPDIPFADWAAPRKGQLSQLLEVGTVDNADPLLISLLSQGLTGQEAIAAIRNDPRFLQTNRMYNELSGAATELGRMFGFIG